MRLTATRVDLFCKALVWLTFVGALVSAMAVASAQQPGADRSSELQSMVRDISHQLALQAKFDRTLAESHYVQLSHALDAWNKSARGPEDFRQMQTWLSKSLVATSAGSRSAMPAVPTFTAPGVASPPVVRAAGPTDESSKSLPEPKVAVTRKQVEVSKPANETPMPWDESPQTTSPVARGKKDSKPEVKVARDADVWSRHPAAKPAEIGDPFVDDPPTVTMAAAPPSHTVLRPATSRDDVQLNLAELTARIRGYDRGIRAVEAKLIAGESLSAEKLLLVVRELQELTRQRELIEMYYTSLRPDEAKRVTRPATTDKAKTLIESRLKTLKPATNDAGLFDDVFGEDASPALDEVEKLLEEI